MKDSQRHQLRASEIRGRLAEIAGLGDDALTDEIRSESDKLTTEYRDRRRDTGRRWSRSPPS